MDCEKKPRTLEFRIARVERMILRALGPEEPNMTPEARADLAALVADEQEGRLPDGS